MGKFNVSTAQPGGMTVLDELIASQLPVQQEQEAAAPAPEPAPEAPPVAAPSPEVAPLVEEGITAGLQAEADVQQQINRELIPDIKTRRQDTSRVDVYDYNASKANSTIATDGGMGARAKNMSTLVESKGLGIGGLSAAGQGPAKQALESIGAVKDQAWDPDFLMMMSAVTENAVAGGMYTEDSTIPTDLEGPAPEAGGPEPFTKAKGNQALGNQIAQEYTRWKNKREGTQQPVQKIDPEQATLLGDMAKEMYFDANKTYEGQQFMTRSTAPDGQVVFNLTKHGADMLARGAGMRKRMFPKQHVRPSKIAAKGGKLFGESRLVAKPVSGAVGGVIGDEVLQQAMHNLGSVANVVDTQRMKILLATALPVLSGEVDPKHPFSTINHVGQDKLDAFVAKQKKDPEFDAVAEYQSLVSDLAQDIFGVSNEKDGANYLSYYLQAATGRIAPQQTHFDPTRSKSVRFVTRNAVPSKAVSGNRVDKNLRQMYAMMLVPGADTVLPREREKMLARHSRQMLQWGRKLRDLVNSISDDQVNAVAEAIVAGTPVTDPNFPKLPPMQIADPELEAMIAKKGEDGQAYIDGLIDFANYMENMQKGKPHYSYFNAYMDGKTNGLASNGIQMGNEKMAFKTGVLRSQDQLLLDNDEDIRDELKKRNLELLDEGMDGAVMEKFGPTLTPVAAAIMSDRTLNKATTMTFGYGKEMESFKQDIDNRLAELEEGNPELAEQVALASKNGELRADLVEAIHGQYIKGMYEVMDPEALKARELMRGAATLFALTDELFSITSPTGFKLNMGGDVTTGFQDGQEYSIWTEGKYRKTAAGKYDTVATAAAPKRRMNEETGEVELDYGGTAWGRSVVTPVQSIDAATVAKTASGRSWGRLRSASNGNPYMHTIYDAFKVDAMGYDVVLDEVNKNWLDASMDWSYLEATKEAIKELRTTYGEKLKGKSGSEPASPTQQAFVGGLFEPNDKGFPSGLKRRMEKILGDPDAAYKATINMKRGMEAAGYKAGDTLTVGQLNKFIKMFNDEANLVMRLEAMIRSTDIKKKELKKKIKASGNEVYQYYAH